MIGDGVHTFLFLVRLGLVVRGVWGGGTGAGLAGAALGAGLGAAAPLGWPGVERAAGLQCGLALQALIAQQGQESPHAVLVGGATCNNLGN